MICLLTNDKCIKYEPIAYADDIVIPIAGSAMNKLQKKGQEVTISSCYYTRFYLVHQEEAIVIGGKDGNADSQVLESDLNIN